jgi:hypothetical protein
MLPGAGPQMSSFYLTAQTTQHLSRGSSQAHDLVCAQHLAFSAILSQQKILLSVGQDHTSGGHRPGTRVRHSVQLC